MNFFIEYLQTEETGYQDCIWKGVQVLNSYVRKKANSMEGLDDQIWLFQKDAFLKGHYLYRRKMGEINLGNQSVVRLSHRLI